ncbi:MAG: hypothetical protein OXU63_10785 [Acidobacteriota bacterium]|nr:hypothetical protein [Acidobacteriota bacterium]
MPEMKGGEERLAVLGADLGGTVSGRVGPHDLTAVQRQDGAVDQDSIPNLRVAIEYFDDGANAASVGTKRDHVADSVVVAAGVAVHSSPAVVAGAMGRK